MDYDHVWNLPKCHLRGGLMEQNETRTLWISIAAAVFAVILLYSWAQGTRSTYARKFGQTKTVVVAKENISEMSIIEESKLELVEKPSDFVEPNAIDNPKEAVGLLPLAPILKGEQILNTKLVPPGASTGLSMQVAPRKRAFTIPVDEIRGVSKLIQPGDRVDLIAAADVGKGTQKEKKVKTIMQDVPVLSVGPHIVDNIPVQFKGGKGDGSVEIQNLRMSHNYKTITVEVRPEQVQLLIHLHASGNPIYAALRNPNDRFVTDLPTADINSVLGRPRRVPTVAKPKPKPVPKPAKKPAPRKKRRGRFEEI